MKKFGKRSSKKRSKKNSEQRDDGDTDDSRSGSISSVSTVGGDQEAHQQRTPSLKSKLRESLTSSSRKRNNERSSKQQPHHHSSGGVASSSDVEEPTNRGRIASAATPSGRAHSYDQIRSVEVKRRPYNKSDVTGRDSFSSLDDGAKSVGSSSGYFAAMYNSTSNMDRSTSNMERSRSTNTADYFTIFTNTNNVTSTYSGGNLAHPNSWTQSLERRSRSRYDSNSEDVAGDPNRLDGHRFQRVSGTSPVRSRESLSGDHHHHHQHQQLHHQQQQHHHQQQQQPLRQLRTRQQQHDPQQEEQEQGSRKNFGFIAAFKV